MIVNACAAGLCAFGDMKNALKIKGVKNKVELNKPRVKIKRRVSTGDFGSATDEPDGNDNNIGGTEVTSGGNSRGTKSQEEVFFDSFTTECNACNGEGVTYSGCSKCKGAGTCINAKCNDGIVIEIGFNGYRRQRKCPLCGGSSQCKKCDGAGKVAAVCKRCNGSKRSVQKDQALALCRELLKVLAASEKETKGTEKAKE